MDVKNLIAGLIIFVTSVAGYVVLTLQHADTSGLVTLVGPILAGAYAVRAVNRRADEQNYVIGQIHENTNGVLDDRIKNGVRAVLDERNL